LSIFVSKHHSNCHTAPLRCRNLCVKCVNKIKYNCNIVDKSNKNTGLLVKIYNYNHVTLQILISVPPKLNLRGLRKSLYGLTAYVRDNSPVELVIILYLMFFGNVLPSHGRLVNTTPAMTSHTLLSRQI